MPRTNASTVDRPTAKLSTCENPIRISREISDNKTRFCETKYSREERTAPQYRTGGPVRSRVGSFVLNLPLTLNCSILHTD